MKDHSPLFILARKSRNSNRKTKKKSADSLSRLYTKNNLMIIGVAVVIIILIIILISAGKQRNKDDDSIPQVVNNTPAYMPVNVSVIITHFVYYPKNATIKVGDTVIWTNRDAATHTATSDSGIEIDSPGLTKNKEYSHTFTKPGVYPYHCRPHPNEKGFIIVT